MPSKAAASIFATITSPEALAEGFRRVKRNKSGAGGDGETLASFEAALAANLAALSRELRDGTYRPGPLTRYPIAKPDGRKRWLGIPSLRDRVAQGAAASGLSAVLEPGFNDNSFAYRPGRSVEHAAGRIVTWRLQGFAHMIEGDIATFFDSVPHAVVIERLRGIVDIETRRLVGLWLGSFGQRRWFRSRIGLAQGSPLSPVLANLVLNPIDHVMNNRRVKFVRYGDDFLIQARNETATAYALTRLTTELNAIGLKLHPDKTRAIAPGEDVAFLGLSFAGDRVSRAASEVV